MVRFALWFIATAVFLGTSRAANVPDRSRNPFEDLLRSGGPGSSRRTCENLNCESGRICVYQPTGAVCGIKTGLPCKFEDYCEGKYYCPSSKVCAGGPDGIPEGSPCPQGIGCKPGLYCDRNQKVYKCLKIQGGNICTGDSECKVGCQFLKGCYCDNGKCISNP